VNQRGENLKLPEEFEPNRRLIEKSISSLTL
jgi:hypothetical protein